MFFKDIADHKKYISSVNAGFEFSQIAIYLKEVDRSIFKKYLGKDLLEDLQTAFDDVESADALTTPVKELVELLRISSAHFSIVEWIVPGQVNMSQKGVTINSTETSKTAFQWQINDIKESFNEKGYNALEEALGYLEENIDATEFASYKTSDAFKENNYLFVSSAKEFAKFFSAFENSRINFFKIRSSIRKVEDFEIKAVIMPDLFDDLKTKLQSGDVLGSLSQKIVDMIKPALVNLSIAKAINDLATSVDGKGFVVFDNTGSRGTIDNKKNAPDNLLARIASNALSDGKTYLDELAKYLENNKVEYPLFAGDSRYIAPADEVNLNSGNKNFWIG